MLRLKNGKVHNAVEQARYGKADIQGDNKEDKLARREAFIQQWKQKKKEEN